MQTRPEGAVRHESIQKSGIGIAVKEEDRFALGVTVLSITELPAIGQ